MTKSYRKENSKFYIKEEVQIENYYSYITVTGIREFVFLRVAELLDADTHTPMYEHMRLKISEIESLEKTNMISVKLSKSNYIGD